MLITSSRKPSASTRTLCKLLASFFNCAYFNRGKMGMGEVLDHADTSPLMVIGEYHGNPGSISVYDPDGFCVLSIYMSVWTSDEPYCSPGSAETSLEGKGELAPVLSELLQMDENPSALQKIVISDKQIDFLESDRVLFSLKIRSHRIFHGDDS